MTAPGDADTPHPAREAPAPVPAPSHDRWALVWDVLVFQVKLGLDALRDVVLSPLSFGALILGLVLARDNPYRYFERLLRLGRTSEHVINLFGSARVPYDPYAQNNDTIAVDRIFGNVEELLRRNVDGSRNATAAFDAADTALDELEARLERLRAEARRKFRPDA